MGWRVTVTCPWPDARGTAGENGGENGDGENGDRLLFQQHAIAGARLTVDTGGVPEAADARTRGEGGALANPTQRLPIVRGKVVGCITRYARFA